jgi:hypothetical protein
MKTETDSFYLFASDTGTPVESSATVFYKVEGESFAKSLCRLFRREYADQNGRPSFHHKAATLISADEQVLLDESLGWLDHYDEPDRGVYDPPPPRDVHLRAQYAVRAKSWEEALRELAKACDQSDAQGNSDSAPRSNDMRAEDWRNAGLTVLMLLAQAYFRS